MEAIKSIQNLDEKKYVEAIRLKSMTSLFVNGFTKVVLKVMRMSTKNSMSITLSKSSCGLLIFSTDGNATFNGIVMQL
mgnify:CR=1 FL=1